MVRCSVIRPIVPVWMPPPYELLIHVLDRAFVFRYSGRITNTSIHSTFLSLTARLDLRIFFSLGGSFLKLFQGLLRVLRLIRSWLCLRSFVLCAF